MAGFGRFSDSEKLLVSKLKGRRIRGGGSLAQNQSARLNEKRKRK
jgi:hypothetical protein